MKIRLHLQFTSSSRLETFFEDEDGKSFFPVLDLDGPAPVCFGVAEGEAWYSWSWCWESTQEADQALLQVPDTFVPGLNALIAKVNRFLAQSRQDNMLTGQVAYILDLQDELDNLRYPIHTVSLSPNDIAVRLKIYRKRILSHGPGEPGAKTD